MAVTFMSNLCPFSSSKYGDLALSNHLVSTLSIPEDTKQFVFAIREPQTQSVIYILSTSNLSKRSAFDAEFLIKEIKPDAVVIQTGDSSWTEIQSEESELKLDAPVPSSSYGVFKRCFVNKNGKETCENAAGNSVLLEIFGTSFHGHLMAAKRAAEDVGSSFLVLESTSRSLSSGNSSEVNNPVIKLKRFSFSDDVMSQMLKPLSLLVDPRLGDQSSLASVETTEEIQPRSNYDTPNFAKLIYPLLEDLHNIFADFLPIGRSLAHLQKLLVDVNGGDKVDTKVVSEVYTFQVAVEGLRIALSHSGLQPISRKDISNSAKIRFSELPAEDKSHVILAQALKSQARKFKTIVAVIDAGSLAGIRKHWYTPLPAKFKVLVKKAIANPKSEGVVSNHKANKRSLREKPMVAVGVGAAAVLGIFSLKKLIPSSNLREIISFKVPIPIKVALAETQGTFIKEATASTVKLRSITECVIAFAQRIKNVAKTSNFEITVKQNVQQQQQPAGFLPWATLACGVGTLAGLLIYGDGIVSAVGSLPAAPSIATLGRGIQNLRETSQVVMLREVFRINNSIKSLMNRMKKGKDR